ncbi:MAG: hypothetical protein IPG03_06985 [Candidatus Microthrix sp.]|nr:hypothetical protein [Candidatus Microthrix sp.]MBK6502108.1 hypothetical protein [Candidatus Microthrix sp.]
MVAFLVEGDVVVKARRLQWATGCRGLLIGQGRRRPPPDCVAAARAAGAQVIGAGPGLVLAITGSATHSGCLGLLPPGARRSRQRGGRSPERCGDRGRRQPGQPGLIARSAVAMGAEAAVGSEQR